jgi:light-regulated signal transduction histidine kinase (bacteriophytochrome)
LRVRCITPFARGVFSIDIETTTPTDLNSCDREPIHIPGSIQPRGIMLVVDQADLRVRYAAGEIERQLGIIDWENQPLAGLIGSGLAAKVRELPEPRMPGGYVGRLEPVAGAYLDVSAHASASYIIVELEPASCEELSTSLMLDRLEVAAGEFEHAASLTALCEKAAVEFRRLTGFDRVMIYRFLDDEAGKVVAESKRDNMHAFMNHHFPASDIPRQARALYVRNLIRVISDVTYEPALLRPDWSERAPLDMSDSSLRSVSPIHLQYLRNMGVRASASVSIVKDGVLWGLIACHNETPRSLTYDVRAACRSLAGSLARQIKAKDEAEGYRQRIRLRGFEDDIIAVFSREGALETTLSDHLGKIRRMMDADGVAILRANELITGGVCPGDSHIKALAGWLVALASETVFSTDQLSAVFPAAREFNALGSGVLAVTLSLDEPWFLFWFRVEQAEVVDWAGNPHKSQSLSSDEPLTPRSSFEAWREIVSGRALAWTLPEIDAAKRLRTALLDIQQNRHVRALNIQLTNILRDKDLLLRENEFLIGEVNHRIQNSLQLVSSFLSLQSRASDNPDLHVALEEARRRLTAVALVHRRLYRGEQVDIVDAGRYIEDLCADTISYMGKDWARYLTLDLAPIMISTDLAVPLSLVLTELMINCNKYAYGGEPGPIEIRLSGDHTHLHLVVADKGHGDTSAAKGFGSRVVDGLIAQLGGKLIASDNKPGVRTAITIPFQKPKSPS